MPANYSNDYLLLSLFIYVVIASLTAYYANQKGRNSTGWFLIGLLIGLFAPLILYFLPNIEKSDKIADPIPPLTSLSSPAFKENLPISSPIDALQPVPLKDDKLWYYLDRNHQQYGPVSLIALKDLWDTGKLELSSFVWSEGMAQWEIVDHLPHLKEDLKNYQG